MNCIINRTMNKYNKGDTVYYIGRDKTITKGKITHILNEADNKEVMYQIHEKDWTSWGLESNIYPTVDELIEWLRTTVKDE